MEVYIQQGKDEIETTIKVLERANPSVENKVLIKPNLTMPYPPKYNVCTSPKVVEGIIQYLKNEGVEDIVIGEGTGGARDMSNVFEVTGYKELSDRLGVPLINLNQDEAVELKISNSYLLKKIKIAKEATKRYVINVPKLKTHRMAVVSLAMKNLVGLVLPYDKKSILHPLYEKLVRKAIKEKRVLRRQELSNIQKEFFKRLIDFYSVFKPSLSIIDGFSGREGDGLTLECGNNIKMNCVLLSEDVVNIDYVAAYLIGLDLNDSYLKYVKGRKVKKLREIDIISNKDINRLKKKFKPVYLTEKIIIYD